MKQSMGRVALSFVFLLTVYFFPLRAVTDVTTWFDTAYASALFVIFVLHVHAAGQIFVKSDIATNTVVGMAAFSAVAFALAHIGWVGDAYRWLWLAPFPLIAWRSQWPLLTWSWRRSWINVTAGAVVVAWMTLALVAALRVDPFTDPLWYHLVTPRFWWESGRAVFPLHHIISAQSSFWEYFLLWIHVLFAGHGARGLVIVQQMAQEAHVVFGFLLSFALMGATLRILFKDRVAPSTVWLLLMIAMSFNAIQGMAQLAKNDWFAAAFAWGALYLAVSNGPATLTFLLLGFAVATKFSILYFALPFVLYLWPPKRVWLWGLLPLLAIFVRNAVWIGNPFFPLFTSHFHSSVVSQTFVEAMAWNEAPWNAEYLSNLLRNLKEIAWQTMLWPLVLTGCVYLWGKDRASFPSATRLSMLFVASLLLSVLCVGKRFDYRLLAAVIVPLYAIGLTYIALYVGQQGKFGKSVALGLALSGSLIWGDFRWEAAKGLRLFAQPQEELHAHPGMDVYAWIWVNLKPEDKILVLLEPAVYYLQTHNFVRAFEDEEMDATLRAAPDATSAVRSLRDKGFRYLLISSFHWDHHWNYGVLEKLTPFLLEQRQAVLVDSKNAQRRLLDLNKVLVSDSK